MSETSEDVTHDRVLALLGALAEELNPGRRVAVSPASSLDRDLGIDSLGRMELALRIERQFKIQLSEQAIIGAESAHDLIHAIRCAGPAVDVTPSATVVSTPRRAHGGTPEHAQNLIEVLDWHLEHQPDRIHIHLYASEDPAPGIRYRDLTAEAEGVAAALRAAGIELGDRVAIMQPTGRAFFNGFIGTLLAGGVPVPIYPPQRLPQLEAHLSRQAHILNNAGARWMFSMPEAKPLAPLVKSLVPGLREVLEPDDCREADAGGRLRIRSDAPAMLQYTSGSTGDPKGVTLSHANLLANIRAMGTALGAGPEDVFVSWLPLYHDMGLIGAWLGSLYYGIPLVVMSPLAFIARPHRWLRAVHEYRGTLSAAPNFAYETCATRIDDEELAGLDLRSWRWALNGAEPVSPQTLEAFAKRFAPCGFRREALAPVYGLAENSVGLAFAPPGRGPRYDIVGRNALADEGRAAPPTGPDPAQTMVCCGYPLPDHEIRIVDDADHELPERRVGHLQFRGPSSTRGYFDCDDANRALFHGDWLDSGDYAYLAEGEVVITGRATDLIIRGGRNYYPYELEQAIGGIPAIRPSGVAVFSTIAADTNQERIVVLAETRERKTQRRESLLEQIRACAMALWQIAPDDVVLVPPRTVLKTSSGKIRRAACRERYERGRLTERHGISVQIARLLHQAVVPASRRAVRVMVEYFYAGYAPLAALMVTLIGWPLIVLTPTLTARQWLARTLARSWFGMIGIRVEQVPAGYPRLPHPAILVANHASYIDSIALAAALPAGVRMTAKRELSGHFFTRVLLHRLGVMFLERFNHQRGLEDAHVVADAVSEGDDVLFFPEGTFTRSPGLRAFRMGAFVIAAKTGAAVVPIALHGTRSILRGDEWFMRHGRVRATIGEAVTPDGTEWENALALRDAARAFIREHCGEPELLEGG